MAFTVIDDACILFPVALRDLFIRLGQTGLFRPKWSERILQEFAEAVRRYANGDRMLVDSLLEKDCADPIRYAKGK